MQQVHQTCTTQRCIRQTGLSNLPIAILQLLPRVSRICKATMHLLRILYCLSTVLFISATSTHAQSAAAYIVVDDHTGHILDAANATDKLQIASLTKVAMALVVLDWAELQKEDLSRLATISPEAMQQGEINPLGLQPGDQISLRDALYAALLQSDNIAAHTLAEHVGRALYELSPPKVQKLGPVGVFVAQMNALATRLHMKRTLFLNPHGLDSTERKPPYSTAADMARLTRYAIKKSGFRFYVSQQQRPITILTPAGQRTFVCVNTNELLGTNDIDGVKTGRTRRAGDCLILSAARTPESRKEGDTFYVTPRRLTVVVLGAQNRFPVALSLLNRGWQIYDQWTSQGRPLDPDSTL